ncbi:MAG: hypothetical protein REI64_09390 [Pedobacter sp.]|uniref:hypothetical protein n=1 Tax=Pedobacter sp. TaxID=1411316 RepID=UPI00280692D5|nr:hypothetical protein [Pedobacter sp.]MDQ8004998.1 hypothetical protein [Pedobacter sp.]
MKKHYLVKACIIALTVATIGCKKSTPKDGDEPILDKKGPEVVLNNNESALNARISYPNTAVSLMSVGTKGVEFREDFSQYNLQLIAEVAAPTHQGKTLQATHIDFSGNKVYVSYNTRGETYLGGVDVFDVSNEAQPRLISQAIMPNTDISSVVFNNNFVYLASATDVDKDASLTAPAVLDRIALSNGVLTSTSGRVQLKGFVGKNILAKNNKIYVVSSTQGGLSVINPTDFKEEKSVAITGSSALASNASGSNIFVLKDKPGQILGLNASDLSVAKTINLAADLPETASHIETINDNFLHAAGKAGLNYLSSTGSLIDNIPVPVIAGVDPEDIVTNNVSINNNLIYIANGAAGLYVAKLEGSTLVLLGKVSLGASTNYVKSSGNLIFVATGTGGLKILKMTAIANSSSTVACDGRATLASDANGWRNLNTGVKEYFTGTTTLGGLNVNTNAIFDFCGSLTLNYSSNINTGGAFLVNGAFVSNQQFNINAFTEVVGSANFKNTLTVNSNGKLKLLPKVNGEIYPVTGDFNVNGLAEINNGSLQISNKLSINSSGRLRLVNTNLVVNGDFDLNGTIEFVGTCNVIINGRYTRNSSGNVIGTNTGKVL